LYEPANLPRVLQIGARLVGVNNRDLRTFKTDLEHTLRLRRQIPADRIVVGESGIRHPAGRAFVWKRSASTRCWSAKHSWPTTTSGPPSTNCWDGKTDSRFKLRVYFYQ